MQDVGIGITTPAGRLDVAQGDLVVTDAGVTQVQLAGIGPGGELRVRNDDGTETLEILGGGSAAAATLSTFNESTGSQTTRIDGDVIDFGGAVFTFSEDGFIQTVSEPDFDGEGAFVVWRRTNSSVGMFFEGNPTFNITGTVSSTTIDANASGSSSVVLPTDAIQASEILDEADRIEDCD